MSLPFYYMQPLLSRRSYITIEPATETLDWSGNGCTIDSYSEIPSSDLSKCDKLEKLELASILEGFRIKLPTHCMLKEFIYDDSFEYWFRRRTLNKIERIVKQNGGKILRITRAERLPRKSENSGQEQFLERNQHVSYFDI